MEADRQTFNGSPEANVEHAPGRPHHGASDGIEGTGHAAIRYDTAASGPVASEVERCVRSFSGRAVRRRSTPSCGGRMKPLSGASGSSAVSRISWWIVRSDFPVRRTDSFHALRPAALRSGLQRCPRFRRTDPVDGLPAGSAVAARRVSSRDPARCSGSGPSPPSREHGVRSRIPGIATTGEHHI